MDARHTQNAKIWCKSCLFCIKKYPIRICIISLFVLSCMFVPLAYTILIYSSPLVGFSFLVHRILLGIDRRKVKQVQEDNRKKKFAKSCRSFKSKYGDRSHLSRRNRKEKSGYYSDSHVEDKDDIFSKSLNDLLAGKTFLIDEKPKEIGKVNVESLLGRVESSSSSNNHRKYGNVNDDHKEKMDRRGWVSADEDDKRHDVRWKEDDQKNVMDLGLLETERNTRLESLMQRRRSRKNLNFLDKEEETGNKNGGQISAIKVVKINPFLEVKSCGKETPGSAPSLSVTRNPFDLPYDPHEEKLDLSGDDFHEEFNVSHHKEPVFCRHQSFRLGAFSHPDITNDKHNKPFYKDLSTKKKTFVGLGTSTAGDYEHIEQDSPISDDSNSTDNLKEEDESSEGGIGNLHQEEKKEKEIMLEERKADIVFFYGGNKRLGHLRSNSVLSDLQVEVSDDEPSLNDLDVHKLKGSWLSLSSLSEVDSEVVKPDEEEEDDTKPLSDLPSSSTQEDDNHIHEPSTIDVQQSENHARQSENRSRRTRNPSNDRDGDNVQIGQTSVPGNS